MFCETGQSHLTIHTCKEDEVWKGERVGWGIGRILEGMQKINASAHSQIEISSQFTQNVNVLPF